MVGSKLTAQHCPFDHSGVFIVSVKDSISNTSINNLRITLVDAKRNPIINKNIAPKFFKNSYFNSDSIYVFHYNTLKNFPKLNRIPPKGLPVSRDTYFLIVRGYLEDKYGVLKIEDQNGNYKTRFVSLLNYKRMPLCTSIKEVWSDNSFEKKRTFDIYLNKKEN